MIFVVAAAAYVRFFLLFSALFFLLSLILKKCIHVRYNDMMLDLKVDLDQAAQPLTFVYMYKQTVLDNTS